MSKPSIDTLEAIALRNRLDMIILQARSSPTEAKQFYENQAKPLAERYKQITGEHYIYYPERMKGD